MHAKKSFLNQVFFAVFLLLGLSTGFFISRRGLASSAPPPSPEIPHVYAPTLTAPPTTRQHNLLLVGVDDLSLSNARLESVWLVMHYPDTAIFSFMPLYPSPLPAPSNLYATPHEPLHLDPGSPSTLEKFDFIASSKIWWDDVVVVDETAVIQILSLPAGADTGENAQVQYFVALPSAWEAPKQAHIGQAALLAALCERETAFFDLSNLDRLFTLVPSHISVSMDESEIMSAWHRLAGNGPELNCDFPLQEQQ